MSHGCVFPMPLNPSRSCACHAELLVSSLPPAENPSPSQIPPTGPTVPTRIVLRNLPSTCFATHLLTLHRKMLRLLVGRCTPRPTEALPLPAQQTRSRLQTD